jgi:putative lipoic acid-binding regulatory protein
VSGQEEPTGLTFPTDYPVKVLGRPGGDFRERVHAIVLRHAPGLDPDRVSERLSANGNFLSVSYLLTAHNREQIEALVAELKACDGVLMLL